MHVSGAEYKSAISTSAEKYQALKFIYTEQKSFKMIYFVIYRSDRKSEFRLKIDTEDVFQVKQGSHSTWKTWKNESTPGKPGNIIQF